MAKRQIIIIAAITLIIGIAVGFSSAWIIQQGNINTLNSTIGNQALVIQNGEIKIQAKVNGDMLNSTQLYHGVVYKEGKNAAMALFQAEATPESVYNALVSLGATPGNNLQLNSPAGTLVNGTSINVYVTWDGAPKQYTLAEVLTNCTTNIKFGGNLATNTQLDTGCILCLDSCAVGITSNAAYGWSSGNLFAVNTSVLPTAGTTVTIILVPQV